MELRLIHGRARSGKTSACYAEMAKLLEDGYDKALILIVPEQFTLEAEKSLAELTADIRRKEPARMINLINAEVLSFKRLAYRILNETGGTTLKRLNTPGRLLLLSRTVNRLKNNLEILSPSASHSSFTGVMSSTISELKRCNISCDTLADLISRVGGDEYLGRKLSEIHSVYSGFQAELADRYRDMDDDLTDVSGRIQDSRWLKDAYVWVDEFSSFTPQEYRIIGELLGSCKSVAVTLCMDDRDGSSPVFTHIEKTAKRLSDIAQSKGGAIIRTAAGKPSTVDGIVSHELDHLENNLYTFPNKKYADDVKDIWIFKASGLFSEVENCAMEIVRSCREEGLSYKDISVALGDAATYAGIISVVFPLYGIPFFIDTKKPVERNPLVEFIRSAMEIISENWKYEPVFRYLKTGLSDVCREDADLLENYVLAYGIKGSMWFDDGCWRYPIPCTDSYPDRPADTELQNLARIRHEFLNPLVRLSEVLKGKDGFDARHACAGLYEFLCETGVPSRLQDIVDDARNSGELTMADEYRQVWNIVMDVLDQFVGIYTDDRLTAESFNRELSAGFAGFEIGLVPPSLDQVVVGTITRSRSKGTGVLYILGANDGFFPAPPRNEGIISDAERARISDFGVELAQDTRSKVFEDEFAVYRVLSRATKRLVLSCSIADAEGRSLRPSAYLSRIRRIFPAIEERSNVIFNDTDESNNALISMPQPTFNHLVRFMRRQSDGFAVNPVWEAVRLWYAERSEWRERLAYMSAALGHSYDAVVTDSRMVSSLYSDKVYTSISRVESYIACPFSFYVKYGLRARAREVFRLEPPDVGTFMHEAIDRFFRGIEGADIDIRDFDYDMCLKAVDGIVDAMLDEMPVSVMKSSKRHKYISGRLKRVIARSLYMTSEHYRRSGFKLFAHEAVFGGEGMFPYISIALDEDKELLLTGRIDRVDVLELSGTGCDGDEADGRQAGSSDVDDDSDSRDRMYVRIIDYKSGHKDFDLSDAYHGLQLQLIAYLDAICAAWAAQGSMDVRPGGIFYYHLDDPIVRTDRFFSEIEADKALMKELRMKGLVLNDARLIKEMDRQVDGSSLIIPAAVKNGLVSSRSSAATLEQFGMLRHHVARLLRKTGDGIVNGQFPVTPYKKKSLTACSYCEYLPVCGFEPALTGKGYRILRDFPDAKCWNLIAQEDHE